MPNSSITTTCCIAGGGPAGMMLGFLLARAGVHVVVLEKYAGLLPRFSRRHHSSVDLELMYELGLLDEFLKLPHSEDRDGSACQVRFDDHMQMIDFTPSADAVQIRGDDAAVGFSQFFGRARQALQDFRSAHEDRGDRPDRGGRAHRRAARQVAGRRAGDPRRSGGRLRRAAFDGARQSRPDKATTTARRWTCCGSASRARTSDPTDDIRPYRSRQDDGHARPRRLLAVRLCHSEGRHRSSQGRRLDAFRERVVSMSPFLGRSRR